MMRQLTGRTVHEARPDVLCVAHSHSLYGRAFSALNMELPILSQDGCMFYNVSIPLIRSLYVFEKSANTK